MKGSFQILVIGLVTQIITQKSEPCKQTLGLDSSPVC